MLDWHGSGQSVMEMSHRGKEFMGIAAAGRGRPARADGASPPTTRCCSCRAAPSLQFAMIPINLLRGKAGADYVHTGEWAKKAIKEAKNFCKVNVVASAEDKSFTYAPAQADWKLDKDAAYVHYTANETIGGVEFHWMPETGDVPLVCDMSSNILSRPVDVSQVRPDLRRRAEEHRPGRPDHRHRARRPDRPGAADAAGHARLQDRMSKPTRCTTRRRPMRIYIAGLVFQWLKKNGGLAAMEQKQHREGAAALRLPRSEPSSIATRSPRPTARA